MRARPIKPRSASASRQGGALLVEALVGILLFSVGILGLVGLHATALQQSGEARYRAEAALLAEQVLGEMWTGDRSPASIKASFKTCADDTCAGYHRWYQRVSASLPGVTREGPTRPEITVEDSGVVTVQVRWRPPSAAATDRARAYSTSTQIANQ